MAPKRKVVSVKKVVRETVEVAMVETNNNNSQKALEELQQDIRTTTTNTSTDLDQAEKEHVIKTIPVQYIGRPSNKETTKEGEHITPSKPVGEEEPPKETTSTTSATTTASDDQEKRKESNTSTSEFQSAAEEAHKDGEAKTKKKDVKEEKKAEAKTTTKKRKRMSKSRVDQVQGGTVKEEYKRYVFRVLKRVHPGMAISAKAMTVVNNMMNDMFERLADEAARLSAYSGRATMSPREIQGAVRLVLPGDLGKHAIAVGCKAVTTYMSSNDNDHNKHAAKPKAKTSV